jgi:hydroxyacylglutathione hydrolase
MSQDFNVVQINENSWYVDGPVSRAFLFKGREKALLVDTTMGPGDLKSEVDKLVGNMPVILVNTHGDADHIGCNSQFAHTLMHPSEFSYYATKCRQDDARPLPLHDGDEIDIGERAFRVIHVPGHTPGSIVLLNRKERFLIGGDTILQRVFIFGPQRNLRALIDSLQRLREQFFEEFDVVYTAHGEFPLPKSFILQELAGARALLNGELVGTDPGEIPLEGPDFQTAALYEKDESGFYDYAVLKY